MLAITMRKTPSASWVVGRTRARLSIQATGGATQKAAQESARKGHVCPCAQLPAVPETLAAPGPGTHDALSVPARPGARNMFLAMVQSSMWSGQDVYMLCEEA